MESLPLELIDQIGQHLSIRDQTRLRLTCQTYYSLFRNVLESVLSPRQRNLYYHLLFCLERHLFAMDESANETEKLVVALVLCRILNLSFTLIIPPPDKPSIATEYLNLAQQYGVKDPMITSPLGLYNKIHFWASQWNQRLVEGTLIVVHNNDASGMRIVVRAVWQQHLGRSRILYYPSASATLIVQQPVPHYLRAIGPRHLFSRTIQLLMLGGAISPESFEMRKVWNQFTTWCRIYYPSLDVPKAGSAETLSNFTIDTLIQEIATKHILPKVCFAMPSIS